MLPIIPNAGHQPGRVGWRYYGLELPELLLEALYRGNASKIFKL